MKTNMMRKKKKKESKHLTSQSIMLSLSHSVVTIVLFFFFLQLSICLLTLTYLNYTNSYLELVTLINLLCFLSIMSSDSRICVPNFTGCAISAAGALRDNFGEQAVSKGEIDRFLCTSFKPIVDLSPWNKQKYCDAIVREVQIRG